MRSLLSYRSSAVNFRHSFYRGRVHYNPNNRSHLRKNIEMGWNQTHATRSNTRTLTDFRRSIGSETDFTEINKHQLFVESYSQIFDQFFVSSHLNGREMSQWTCLGLLLTDFLLEGHFNRW